MPQDDQEQGHTLDYHFTYTSKTSADLVQGDVLSRTEELVSLLKEVHPHYTQPDYTHFLVLTQTCDLVRRDGKPCKSRYITLAGIRPLSLLLGYEVEEYQDPFLHHANICSMKNREQLERFLHRLFNNNEPDYFYLHDDVVLKFPDRSCAFLRLAISLRAREHYNLCLGARLFSLAEPFTAKLGWLIGNMYSRIGTEDWVPEHATINDFRKQISDILDSHCKFYDDAQIKLARSNIGSEWQEIDAETLRTHIDKVRVASRRDKVLDGVIKVLQEKKIITDEAEARKIRTSLSNDPGIAQALK